ncbi:SUMF1/EgtB/PvdO family nonheme iron enzyme [Rhizobium sp. SSA_523]|uniref:SUMF1/EgtB/PvdO family nonheme iron enzyme n=1 Tax=Rhizobium sp. SSA_523 TaxID=2952477 RepID=UPI002090518F|nr:SUMF1/EgtB/PvdO family nonheme iron enzyme [Rhizobium sp. SSA_523]MCO5734362.1 formylglycine-generating enzyme family protein [Rhizobium sp. SSA_523]WKC21184.1 SUMF1/EgtB/PvdO family nonheme iron enzyme [Rhizobium sp. SSA_523]
MLASMSATLPQKAIGSLLLPVGLIAALSAAVVIQSGMIRFGSPALVEPPVITVEAGAFLYRQPGEFYRSGFAVDGPKAQETVTHPLSIMKFQVSTLDYDACADDGACPARESATPSRADLPATGISHDDATAYAKWLSDQTGSIWRLPDDRELAFAAAEDFPDDALGVDADSGNPALRWLADYEREAARKRSRDPQPLPYGSFGENGHGLADFAGNVWEWTSTCNRRVDLANNGAASAVETCGVYIAAGKHRAPLSSFIRDPKSGGCAVGVPPDHVGFRLVKDTRWYAPFLSSIGIL